MINLKKIFILLFCVVLLSVTFCGCSNNDEELRKVSNNSTNVSVKVKVPPLNRNLNSDTSTTANKGEVKENTTEFSTISKENVEKEIEKSTTKSNNFKSKNKNNPTKNQEKSTLSFFDED